jgi:hypothetical protein
MRVGSVKRATLVDGATHGEGGVDVAARATGVVDGAARGAGRVDMATRGADRGAGAVRGTGNGARRGGWGKGGQIEVEERVKIGGWGGASKGYTSLSKMT